MLLIRFARSAPAFALSFGLAGALVSPAVRAAGPENRTCIASAEQAQLARYHGQLRSAREGFVRCARPECPDPIHTDCLRWLAEVETSLPSVVFSGQWSADSTEPGGSTDILGLRVTIDGEEVADAASGHAVSLDPGEHVIGFTHEGAVPATRKVMIREGEKNRAVRVVLARVNAAPSVVVHAKEAGAHPVTTRPVPLASLLLGVAGVAAISTAVGWYVEGTNGLDELRDSCVHTCASSSVDDQRRKLLVGDISVGVGIVALGAATYLYLRRPTVAASATSATTSETRSGSLPHFDLAAAAAGGHATMTFAF